MGASERMGASEKLGASETRLTGSGPYAFDPGEASDSADPGRARKGQR
jgi:hypothetical protein